MFQRVTNKLRILFWRYRILLLLLLLAFVSRHLLVYTGVIPFSFDHGKDSLAVMHMVLQKTPALIGPWTSIPGLFFGPGWYYLLAPGYVIGQFHPLSGVYTMIILLLVQVYLMYKYFGALPALIVATTPLWFIISTSAWNPFPMTVVSLVLLIVFRQMFSNKYISAGQSFILGLSIASGFHFSSAFAVFLPMITLGYFLLHKIPISKEKFGLLIFGFVIPFIPQLIFELRHDFVQTKAVLGYFSAGGTEQGYSLNKTMEIFTTIVGEMKNAVFFEFRGLPSIFTDIFRTITIILVGCFSIKKRVWKLAYFPYYASLTLLFFVLPFIGYQFLHFNVWYVYGMAPVAVVIFSWLLSQAPKQIVVPIALLFLITPLSILHFSYSGNMHELSQQRSFLPAKIQAIDTMYELADGQPFAVYHYVPDIYDFSYQYLYFWQALHGKSLPQEFAYEPGVVTYVLQKPELIEKTSFAKNTTVSQSDLRNIFFLIEKPMHPHLLDEWWGRQPDHQVIETYAITNELTLYSAVERK